MIKQKTGYIYNNPVEIGFVTNSIDWKYSSAQNYQNDHTILEIEEIVFFELQFKIHQIDVERWPSG